MTTVLRFGGRPVPRALAAIPRADITEPADVDAATDGVSRAVVLGTEADLATVLTRLLRADRLEVEVAHLSGSHGARRALRAGAQRVPLIRDETGTVLVRRALWRPAPDARLLEGEGIVDDTVLFDGAVAGVAVEPTHTMPGLRARVLGSGWRSGPWVSGRAAQLGTPAAVVVRDGVAAPRPVRRSTFYRHIEGWLRVTV